MSPDELRARAETFLDRVFNEKDLGYLRDALAEDFVEHDAPPDMPADKTGMVTWFSRMFDAVPDMTCKVHHVIVSGDKVAVHATYRGTDTGGLMAPAEATGKPFEMGGIDITRYDGDGRVAEHWGITDVMGVMIQLGMVPGGPD